MGSFTNIPFPNVPNVPGVPPLNRAANTVIASSPVISTTLGALENILSAAFQQPARWGLFDQDGNQLGIDATSQGSLTAAIGSAALSQLTGTTAPVVSTVAFEYLRELRVSDFQVENGSFASYNKVFLPATPTITLTLDGDENDRTTFLSALENAVTSTDLYNIVTPEFQYGNVTANGSGNGYTVERFSYTRRAQRGATLIIAEVHLKEVRQVQSVLTQGQLIVSPVDPAATPAVSNGTTLPATPGPSALQSIVNQFPTLKSFLGL
jgi:hypothetical protein